MFATVDTELCVGCGKCAKACPAGFITVSEAAQ
jgi:Fe-S-cluster-containing hydrogenase component 2